MKILITAVLAGALVMTQPSAAAQEAKSYTEDDYYVLSHIISAEAGNCSRDMMVSVGSDGAVYADDQRHILERADRNGV